MIEKFVSGCQTGADRAGLDAAKLLGIPRGGYCPKGRKAEDGRIPDEYELIETESSDYPPRTELNVQNSDGTLIFVIGDYGPGSKLTVKLCQKHNKPYMLLDFNSPPFVAIAALWVISNKIKVLNIAGSRGSKKPLLHGKVVNFLCEVIGLLREKGLMSG